MRRILLGSLLAVLAGTAFLSLRTLNFTGQITAPDPVAPIYNNGMQDDIMFLAPGTKAFLQYRPVFPRNAYIINERNISVDEWTPPTDNYVDRSFTIERGQYFYQVVVPDDAPDANRSLLFANSPGAYGSKLVIDVRKFSPVTNFPTEIRVGETRDIRVPFLFNTGRIGYRDTSAAPGYFKRLPRRQNPPPPGVEIFETVAGIYDIAEVHIQNPGSVDYAVVRLKGRAPGFGVVYLNGVPHPFEVKQASAPPPPPPPPSQPSPINLYLGIASSRPQQEQPSSPESQQNSSKQDSSSSSSESSIPGAGYCCRTEGNACEGVQREMDCAGGRFVPGNRYADKFYCDNVTCAVTVPCCMPNFRPEGGGQCLPSSFTQQECRTRGGTPTPGDENACRALEANNCNASSSSFSSSSSSSSSSRTAVICCNPQAAPNNRCNARAAGSCGPNEYQSFGIDDNACEQLCGNYYCVLTDVLSPDGRTAVPPPNPAVAPGRVCQTYPLLRQAPRDITDEELTAIQNDGQHANYCINKDMPWWKIITDTTGKKLLSFHPPFCPQAATPPPASDPNLKKKLWATLAVVGPRPDGGFANQGSCLTACNPSSLRRAPDPQFPDEIPIFPEQPVDPPPGGDQGQGGAGRTPPPIVPRGFPTTGGGGPGTTGRGTTGTTGRPAPRQGQPSQLRRTTPQPGPCPLNACGAATGSGGSVISQCQEGQECRPLSIRPCFRCIGGPTSRSSRSPSSRSSRSSSSRISSSRSSSSRVSSRRSSGSGSSVSRTSSSRISSSLRSSSSRSSSSERFRECPSNFECSVDLRGNFCDREPIDCAPNEGIECSRTCGVDGCGGECCRCVRRPVSSAPPFPLCPEGLACSVMLNGNQCRRTFQDCGPGERLECTLACGEAGCSGQCCRCLRITSSSSVSERSSSLASSSVTSSVVSSSSLSSSSRISSVSSARRSSMQSSEVGSVPSVPSVSSRPGQPIFNPPGFEPICDEFPELCPPPEQPSSEAPPPSVQFLPRCGDGVVDQGEQCDTGTLNSDTEPDRCRLDCQLPFCGDGVRDRNEQCDDGNRLAGDGCDRLCRIEARGIELPVPQPPVASVIPPKAPPAGQTGPAAIGVMAAGAAAGLAWMRRRRSGKWKVQSGK